MKSLCRAKKQSDERHAILISGFSRNYKDWYKQLLSNLRQGREDIDIFICTWHRSESWNPKKRKKLIAKNDINICEIKEDYAATVVKKYDWEEFKLLKKDFFEKSYSSVAGAEEFFSMYKNTYSMLWLLRETFLLFDEYRKKNNIKYKNLVRARFEHSFKGKTSGRFAKNYPIVDWDYSDSEKENSIQIGEWQRSTYGAVENFQDHFAFGTCENMEHYFTAIENMNKICHSPNLDMSKLWSPEYRIGTNLIENNIVWDIKR